MSPRNQKLLPYVSPQVVGNCKKYMKVDDEIEVKASDPGVICNSLLLSLEAEKKNHPEWFQKTSKLVLLGIRKKKYSSKMCSISTRGLLECDNSEATLHGNTRNCKVEDQGMETSSPENSLHNSHQPVIESVTSGTFSEQVFDKTDATPEEIVIGSVDHKKMRNISKKADTDIKAKRNSEPLYELNPLQRDNNDVINNDLKVKDLELACKVKPLGREVKDLYKSLKEISWAKNWSQEKIMLKPKSTRQTSFIFYNTRNKALPLKDAQISTFIKSTTLPITSRQANIRKIPGGSSLINRASLGESVIRSSVKGNNLTTNTINPISVKKRNTKETEITGQAKKGILCKNASLKFDPIYKQERTRSSTTPSKNSTSISQMPNSTAAFGVKPAQNSFKANTSSNRVKLEKDGNKKGFAVRFDFINNSRSSSGELKETKTTLPTKLNDISDEYPLIYLKRLSEESKKTKLLDKERKEGQRSPLLFDEFVKKEICQLTAVVENGLSELDDTRKSRKRKQDDGGLPSMRSSIRQTECIYRYKEIYVRKHSSFTQIILANNSTKDNGLTIESLRELKEAIISSRKDASSKLILLTSTGNIFCLGINLKQVLTANQQVAEQLAKAIRDVIEALAYTSKTIVAAVNGTAVGLGLSLLLYCDIIFASDKATFYMPYARLGQIPEGAATLRLPQVVGSILSSSMLLGGQRLTASEACIHGLVSEVIWPTRLMEEVIPRVVNIAQQPLQSMELTKMLQRSHNLERLQLTLENESKILTKQWLSKTFRSAVQEVLSDGGFVTL